MPKTYNYIVTGFGQFPEDMMRYDRAKVVRTFNPPLDPKRTMYEIEGLSPPTVGRWSSFMWTVIETPAQRARWGL